MIKLTWGQLRDRDFMESMGNLFGIPTGYETGMKFSLLGREVKKQEKLCQETHMSILKKYGSPDKEKFGHFKIHDATMAEFEKEIEKLNAHEFSVNINKISPSIIPDKALRGQDYMLLCDFFSEVTESVEAGKKPLSAVPNTAAPAN